MIRNHIEKNRIRLILPRMEPARGIVSEIFGIRSRFADSWDQEPI
jgi:hypothetical protein